MKKTTEKQTGTKRRIRGERERERERESDRMR